MDGWNQIPYKINNQYRYHLRWECIGGSLQSKAPVLAIIAMWTSSAHVRLLTATTLSLVLAILSASDAFAGESTPQAYLDSLKNLYSTFGLLAPGVIFLFVRSQFTTGRLNPPHAILTYVVISTIYYAIIFLFASIIPQNRWGWGLVVFVVPIIFGFLSGINTQKGYTHRLFRRMRLNPLHAVPSAWDWKFNDIERQWVLVTLKDETKIFGLFGENSFASSDPNERDIYLEWIHGIFDRKGDFSFKDETGILIAAGEIKTIEFHPFKK